jgi:hypothetical protein
MNKFLLRLAAILLPLSLLGALPAAAQVIIKGPSDSQDWMVLAVMATGPEAEKAKFEAAAEAKGYKPGRSKNNKDEDEVMIVILPTANRADFLKFYSEARAGKYGKLTFDIAITPWAAVKEKRDFIDEARVYAAEAVTVPAE